jgi:histidinol phosphatase-like PHP family hydrolase
MELAKRYFGGLTHMHTRISNHPGHLESDLSVSETVEVLRLANLAGNSASPLGYICFNEHTSDSSRPHSLSPTSERVQRLIENADTTIASIPAIFGLELSCMPGGELDAPEVLIQHRPFVIASRHSFPSNFVPSADAITDLFRALCEKEEVVVLGHPMRHIEGISNIDWPEIFETAYTSGTAIEINFNTFLQANDHLRESFWRPWLSDLAASKASITIGSDIHTKEQLESFIEQWQRLGASDSTNSLHEFLTLLDESGIEPERVISRSFHALQDWLSKSKDQRKSI